MIKLLPKFFSLLLIILLFSVFHSKPSYAATLEDNFDDGDISNWTTMVEPDRTFCSAPWQTKDGMVGIQINQYSCATILAPNDDLWGDLGNDYIIEVDMKFVAGTDHNIAFRFTPGTEKNYWYDIHFMSPNSLTLERVPPGTPGDTVNYPVPNKEDFYHLKIIMETGNVKIYIDDVLVLDYIYDPVDEKFPTGKVALRAGAGSDPISETWFDNLVVTDIEDEPEENIPVVLLPGFGGSWNTTDIISGGSGGTWKKTPFVKVYDNIRNTFLNGGYTEGDDYFEFYYDWREPLDQLADDFNEYLENVVLAGKEPGTKVNLVGHSMGGVIARIYAQKYGLDKIEKIVTSGSPHEGALAAWQGWAGAEIGERWSWQWIGLQLYLQIHKGKYASPVAAVRGLTPGLNDLSPIFNFAKDEADVVIEVSTMDSFNSYLNDLKISLTEDAKELLSTIVGHEDNVDYDTAEWVKLGERSLIDKLLGKWPDGKPVSWEYTSAGDLTVLEKSASIAGALSAPLVTADHHGLMETEEGIQTILDELDLDSLSPVIGVNTPERNPSLLFFLRSPGNIRVTSPSGFQAGEGADPLLPNAIYSPEDDLLVIYDAEDGDYQVEVIGTGEGEYHLDLGQLTETGEEWNTIAGFINNGETDSYMVNFNSSQVDDFPWVDETGKLQLEMAISKLEKLKEYISEQSFWWIYKRWLINYIDMILRVANKGMGYIETNNYDKAVRYVKSVMSSAYMLRIKTDSWSKWGRIPEENWLYINGQAEEIGKLSLESFLAVSEQSGKKISKRQAKQWLKSTETIEKMAVKKMQKVSGENYYLGTTLELAENKLEKAREAFNNGDYWECFANALTSRLLFLEIMRLAR